MTTFATLFGPPSEVQASAPGRVNLIGEHTDYNGGFVLPTPIPQRTTVYLAHRADQTVRAYSACAGGGVASFVLGAEKRRGDWLDYVQGTVLILRNEGMPVGGFDLLVESDVPLGSGLSSSAALDVSLMRVLRQAFGLTLDDQQIAILSQRVENQFVLAQVGIMDPMACSLGEPGKALFLDARTLAYELVPLPAEVDLVVINSGVSHQHATGDYNTRRAECERACALLGIPQLRDLSLDDLPRLQALPEPLGRRARHVVTEDARVLAAVEAMRANDAVRLGQLFNESHESQRNDYEVSIPEIDELVNLARQEPDVFGARLTGGGFGGSIVVLTRAGTGRTVGERIADRYRQQSGQHPTVLVPPDKKG
jgi:galactokinase